MNKTNYCATIICSVCRIAMTRRQMYQRGEDQNKQTGFWGMIKSVTSTQTGSESILNTYIIYDCKKTLNFSCYAITMCKVSTDSICSRCQPWLLPSRPVSDPAGGRCSRGAESTTLSWDCGPASHQGNTYTQTHKHTVFHLSMETMQAISLIDIMQVEIILMKLWQILS